MASKASVKECLGLTLALVPEYLKLSLDRVDGIYNFRLNHNHGAGVIVLPPF